MTNVRAVQLPAQPVPDATYWDAYLSARMFTGRPAVDAVAHLPAGTDVAIDIETPSVTDSFSIKCVTAAWDQGGVTHAVLLDPLRVPAHVQTVRTICERARWLILQNSPFDIPGLVAWEMMTLAQTSKIMDTLLLARMAWPDKMVKKGLEALAHRVLGINDLKDGLKTAQKASGLTSNEKWFRHGDVAMPTYRTGAMSDTVVTLRLAYPLFELAVDRQLDHPFARYGHNDRNTAGELVSRMLRVNRVMLRRSARGYHVDLDYLDGYVESVQRDRERAERTLEDAGIRPGNGLDLVTLLERNGELPPGWPRTEKTQKLSATKESLERLPDGHPLVSAHREIVDTARVLGYMSKTVARADFTGRVHPQWHVLGASETGRMSAGEPEIQQFSEQARPILLADPDTQGFTSIDWSSIEPALLGWMAKDWEFITPFEQGADIYEPVMRSAKCTRKDSKTAVLAGMYGQSVGSLAVKLGVSVEAAAQLQRQMRAAMPKAARFMGQIKQVAEDHAVAITMSGRILPVERVKGKILSYKAVNKTFQGSCADMIYDSILLAEDAGLGDAIALPMHDEIVCDTEAADEVQRCMTTPSERLINWTGGRVPVIRTDRHDLGRHWAAC